MKIYFAGSIRGGREDKEIYLNIIKLLSSYGLVLTEHIGKADLSAMGETNLTDNEIYDRDVSWINESDIIIAEVTRPSLGVGYEIAYAESKGKKIVCIYREVEPGKSLSAMISGNSNFDSIKYTGLDDLKTVFDNLL